MPRAKATTGEENVEKKAPRKRAAPKKTAAKATPKKTAPAKAKAAPKKAAAKRAPAKRKTPAKKAAKKETVEVVEEEIFEEEPEVIAFKSGKIDKESGVASFVFEGDGSQAPMDMTEKKQPIDLGLDELSFKTKSDISSTWFGEGRLSSRFTVVTKGRFDSVGFKAVNTNSFYVKPSKPEEMLYVLESSSFVKLSHQDDSEYESNDDASKTECVLSKIR